LANAILNRNTCYEKEITVLSPSPPLSIHSALSVRPASPTEPNTKVQRKIRLLDLTVYQTLCLTVIYYERENAG